MPNILRAYGKFSLGFFFPAVFSFTKVIFTSNGARSVLCVCPVSLGAAVSLLNNVDLFEDCFFL